MSINILQTGIYKEYRDKNWHSKYLHSHTMQQVIINVVEDYKGYLKSKMQVPISDLVSKIEYKSKLLGIEIKREKESYTSGVSSLDNEDVIKGNYNKKRRIKRGLFITNTNKKINADINGSLNILRKYMKKSSPNLEIAMDNGRGQRPLKRNVA